MAIRRVLRDRLRCGLRPRNGLRQMMHRDASPPASWTESGLAHDASLPQAPRKGCSGRAGQVFLPARALCPTTADIVLMCNKPASVERSRSANAAAPIHFRRASPGANRIILSFETHADRPRTPTFSHEARSGFRRSTPGSSGCARDARPHFHTNPLPFHHNNKGARQDTAACRLRPQGRFRWFGPPARKG